MNDIHKEHGFPLGEPPDPVPIIVGKKDELPCPDKVDVPDMKLGKIGKVERAFHWLQTSPTVRRIGKVGTAVALWTLLPKLGVPAAVATAAGLAYMPIEKAANTRVQAKNGKDQNFDLLTLIFKLVEAAISAWRKHRKGGK